MIDLLDVRAYDYELPDALIAATPSAERAASRLMTVEPHSDALIDGVFSDIVAALKPGDLLVVNDARVSPVRLYGRRATGGRVEVFVVGFAAEGRWDGDGLTAMVKSNRAVGHGEVVTIEGTSLRIRREADTVDGLSRWTLVDPVDPWALLEGAGTVPLPPYIVKRRETAGLSIDAEFDASRYQTVYARAPGAVAAPTAGLHFDDAVLAALDARGVERAALTLLVGAGTFKPVDAPRLDTHALHEEFVVVSADVVDAVQRTRARGGRVVAVGTTVVRALEAAAHNGQLAPMAGATRLFIYPGYRFATVDALITNFHLPRSSLLALVAAFAGYPRLRAAYEHAIEQKYRFYSYGDAMFIPACASPEAR